MHRWVVAWAVAAWAAAAAPARVALVAVWHGPKRMPPYAAQACASLAPAAGARLVLIVDDVVAAGVPAACLDGAAVDVLERGAGGVARGLGDGLARALRAEADSAVRDATVRVLRELPAVVIELKPLWLWAWRDDLLGRGFTHATFTDLDVIFGDLGPWIDASSGSVRPSLFSRLPSEVRILAGPFDSSLLGRSPWTKISRGVAPLWGVDAG